MPRTEKQTYSDESFSVTVDDMWAGEQVDSFCGDRFSLDATYRGRKLCYEIECISELSAVLSDFKFRVDLDLDREYGTTINVAKERHNRGIGFQGKG
tara:strand:- start:447 stop:737 length:291 start_codon:yes stop_codon:yes gene_type:complete